MSEARNWLPEQISNLTMRQLKVLMMDVRGLDGAENIGAEYETKRYKEKILGPAKKKAIENLKQGKRWDS